jgi:hypothetical protein
MGHHQDHQDSGRHIHQPALRVVVDAREHEASEALGVLEAHRRIHAPKEREARKPHRGAQPQTGHLQGETNRSDALLRQMTVTGNHRHRESWPPQGGKTRRIACGRTVEKRSGRATLGSATARTAPRSQSSEAVFPPLNCCAHPHHRFTQDQQATITVSDLSVDNRQYE